MKRLLRRFANDRPLWAMMLLTGHLMTICRQRLLAWLLEAPDLRVGKGSSIRGTRHIRFGRSFHAHGAVWIEAVTRYGDIDFSPRITFGDHVSASEDFHLSCIAQIEVGNNVLFGSRVYVSDHNHGNYRDDRQSLPSDPPAGRRLGGGGPVRIGNNVWIGHNVVIIGPAEIGDGAIVGANSVVRGDIPAGCIVGGIPAKVLKRFDQSSCQWMKT